MRLPPATIAATCLLFLTAGITSAAENPIDLTAKPAAIYKSEETVASAENDAAGTGVRLNYDFEKGGNTARFDYLLRAPLDGPFTKFQVTAKGPHGDLIVIVRDATNQGIAYSFGPLSDDQQTFTVDLSKPLFAGNRKTQIEYPIKALCFLVKKAADLKGTIEVSKVVAE